MISATNSDLSEAALAWVVRIPEVFESVTAEALKALRLKASRRLGTEYHLVKGGFDAAQPAARFVSWNLPVEHAWPCNPAKMEGFVEKAAQGLVKKFASRQPQTVLVGPTSTAAPDTYYKSLAINLRGRLVQLFPDLPVQEVEAQNPESETLYCLVGKEGLYAGMATPRACQGFYPGGTYFVAKDKAISRAGAKIAEALHYLLLHRGPLRKQSRWLELGACPGGMTAELLRRRYEVTAIDVAPLDERLRQQPGLTFVRMGVEDYRPHSAAKFDALLCDMNGPPEEAMAQVVRLASHLRGRGLVIFTLKVSRIDSMREPMALMDEIIAQARAGGLRRFACTHLTSNRHEWTLFLERAE